MRRRRGTVGLVAILVAAVWAAGAAAGVRVRALDRSAHPTVRATVITSSPASARPRVREDGRPVAGLVAENLGRGKSVVLAIDRSQSMSGTPLADAAAAARLFVATKSRADRVAVVAFGATAGQLTGFSAEAAEGDAALKQLSVDRARGTALFDALVLAAGTLAEERRAGRVILVVSDGRDVSSAATLADAVAAVRRSQSVVYAVGIRSAGFAAGPLRRLARETGGRYYATRSTAGLSQLYASIGSELRRTWRLSYVTASSPGEGFELRVTVPGQGTAAVVAGGPRGPGRSSSSPLVGTLLGDLLLALAVAALLLLALRLLAGVRRAGRLRRRVAPAVAAGAEEGPARVGLRLRLAGGRLFQSTERVFGELRQWRALERALTRADLPVRAVELAYAMAGAGAALALLARLVGAGGFGLLVAFLLGGSAPYVFVRLRGRRRVRAFEQQLPDLLLTLASSLKAGQSFRQGIQTIVEEGAEPARGEFQRVLSEARLGRPLDDALAEMAERVSSDDFRFVVSAVTIQRQIGGSLAGVLDMVAETVRGRQQFARKLKALTAQGRMSAYTLIAMPIALGLALTAINPSYMEPLLHTGAGHMLLVVGAVLMGIGSLILRRIAAFES